MSLHNLARHVQAKGRGEDKMLVHMTPGEVQGLQALAMKHGGSLTINPETGLPEAGFLRNILPSVVGGVVGVATMNPMLGAAVGGGLGLATSGGNLTKGIMSGIGAYGFGSLGAGLAASGNASLGAAAMPAAELAGTEALAATGFTPTTAAMSPSTVSDLVSSGVLDQSAANAYGQGFSSAFQSPSTMSSIQEGFSKAAASPGAFFKQNMFPIGAAALGTLAASEPEQQYGTTTVDRGTIKPYTYSQTRNPEFGRVPGAPYFTQTYTAGTPYSAKNGGIVALANGGNAENDKEPVKSAPAQPVAAFDPLAGFTPKQAPQMSIADMYTLNTQRPADLAGLDYWQKNFGTNIPSPAQQEQFQAGATPEQLRKNAERTSGVAQLGLAPSMQTYGYNSYTPEGQIAGLYRNVLGRASDPAGQLYWEKQAQSGLPMENIRESIMISPEAQARQAQKQQVGAYNDILADRAANEYITQAPLLSMLPGGGERANLADTKKLINEYYLSELGRQADEGGLDYWAKEKLATGQSLADIKKHIYDSPEAVARREAQAQQAQTALEQTPEYQAYMNAPISAENFDAEAYLAAHPDVAASSVYGKNPYQHYLDWGRGEGRAVAKKAYQAPTAGSQPGVGGYTYDQATGKFTKVAAPASTTESSGLLGSLASDPNFQNWLQQDAYARYQASLQPSYGGGGKEGGLMPKALKYASGGISNLGDYSDGGRLLKGPGDGVSDSIPAQIGDRQPARLADGEFVVPARIVSELGNGSTDAGARKLYAMMDRIQKKRRKSIGKNKVAVDSKAESVLPA